MATVLVCVGETSADMHAGRVLEELRKMRPDIAPYGVGGDRCAEAGMRLIAHQRDLSVYGAFEMLVDIPRVIGVFLRVLLSVRRERPAAILLVDLPDFNIWLARFVRLVYRQRIPIVYFISPQIWVWRKRRVHSLRRLVERMLVILPFEEELYADAHVPVTFVGHPLVDRMAASPERNAARTALEIPAEAQVIAVLPGSRAGEVRSHLPPLLAGVRTYCVARAQSGAAPPIVIIPRAPNVAQHVVDDIIAKSGVDVRVVHEQTYAVLAAADVALIKLGTAVLEAGLLGTPTMAVGRISALSYFLGWRVLRIRPPMFALVNYILGRMAIPEYIQHAMAPDVLAGGITAILDDPAALRAAAARREELLTALCPDDNASNETSAHRTARAISECIASTAPSV